MTRALALAAAAFAACPGGVPHFEPPVIDPHGTDGGPPTSGCVHDSDCGEAQVCVNCGGVGACAPGCRADSQCGPRDICQLGTVCQRCPCAPGWCVLDPCRDDDADGYVPGDEPTVECAGKHKGDCDDRASEVHPGATELCTNYRDDDCDGVYDERDPRCACPAAAQRCGTSWDCGGAGASACEKGCCQACGGGSKPSCSYGGDSCAQAYGVNPYSGCSYGWVCDACGSCPATVDPVCAVNGSTYDNDCLLRLRSTRLLHRGACLPGEGMYCAVSQGAAPAGLDGGCGGSGELYCRGSCPEGQSCGVSSCTRKGACLVDADCPAGLPPPQPALCDAGTPHLACVDTACVSRCR